MVFMSDLTVDEQIQLDGELSEFFTLELSGSNYERGLQHGRALRRVIRPTVNRFKYDMINTALSDSGTDYQYNDYKCFFYENTGLLKVAEQQVPELVDEIRGMADGAGIPFEDMFVYNLNFDETYWVLEKMTGVDYKLTMAMKETNGKKQEFPDSHCSMGSVWGSKKLSLAYTLDWTRHFEGSQTLIKHVMPNGDVILMTTYAGTLIGHAINASQGYTFTPHSKFMLEHDVDNGLAQIFVYRKLIEAGSTKEANDYLNLVKPASGLSYTLSDFRGTKAYEVSANQISEVKSDGDYMAVANVARANNDLSSSYRDALELTDSAINMEGLPSTYWDLNQDSVEREDIIIKAIKDKAVGQMTPELWQDIFICSPINKPVNEVLSTTNLWHVVEIDEQYIEYYVSAGNPGKLDFENYKIKYR